MKQIARNNIRLDDKQLNKELAKKMLNPHYFTDRNLNVGFKIDLDSHHIIHAESKLTITPNYHEFGFEVRYLQYGRKMCGRRVWCHMLFCILLVSN